MAGREGVADHGRRNEGPMREISSREFNVQHPTPIGSNIDYWFGSVVSGGDVHAGRDQMERNGELGSRGRRTWRPILSQP